MRKTAFRGSLARDPHAERGQEAARGDRPETVGRNVRKFSVAISSLVRAATIALAANAMPSTNAW
ncbi:MAG: hypothetical protein WBE77_11330 [Candidatus Cybelea sp.]